MRARVVYLIVYHLEPCWTIGRLLLSLHFSVRFVKLFPTLNLNVNNNDVEKVQTLAISAVH